jgi:membrane dipeptidase
MSQLFASRRSFLRAGLAGAVASGLSPKGRLHAGPFDSSNEVIQAARQTALSLLRPSDRDLQHGFEVHAQATVFDAYGFAPRAAIDGAAFQRAVEQGLTEQELTDLREEMMMTRMATSAVERLEFLDAFRASGVTCIFQNAGEEGSDPLRLIKRLARFTYATDQMGDDLRKAIAPDDVARAKRASKPCLAFTTNGVPLRQQWESVRDELRLIRIFYQLGVRMMHVTYNRRNPLGDGAGEPNDGGLSDFGRSAIAEMNRVGVIVDVAHSGYRTSREAAQASTRPMVASHTTCAALHQHIRAKPDDTIRAICDSGGLIGICLIPSFLGGNGDVVALLDHIDYAVKKFGADHVAIGTDVSYVSRNDKIEREKIAKRSTSPNTAGRWEHLWPKDSFKPAPEATQSLAWTNWPLFTVGMVQRGHSDETIRKILGENMLRVWRANQPATGD